jgi:hypothetical protein
LRPSRSGLSRVCFVSCRWPQVLKLLETKHMDSLLAESSRPGFLLNLTELHIGDVERDPFLICALYTPLLLGAWPALAALHLHASEALGPEALGEEPVSREEQIRRRTKLACSSLAHCLRRQPGQRRLRTIHFHMTRPSPGSASELEEAGRVCSPLTFEGVITEP